MKRAILQGMDTKKILAAFVFIFALPLSVVAQTSTVQNSEPVVPSDELIAFVTSKFISTQQGYEIPVNKREAIVRSIAIGIATSGEAPEGFTGLLVSTTTSKRTSNISSSCFDYYHFQSVQVNVAAPRMATSAGNPVIFSGVLENQNPYPIVGGQIYVKIFKKNPNAAEVALNADDLIDQYVAQEGVTLGAGEKRAIEISWLPPVALSAGDYKAAFFFQTAKRFNLLGLSFLDDVVGNIADFSIENASASRNIAFDKSSVTMNGTIFNFARPILQFGATTSVAIKAKLVNPSKETVTVPITWTTYNWDALREENFVASTTEQITLKPLETRTVSYVEDKNKGSVSFVVAEVTYKGVKSILDTRFFRTGIPDTRINFPGIMAYPLSKGEEATLFSCFHSTGAVVPESEIILTLKDMKGKVIHTATYQGTIAGPMSVMKDMFTPVKSYTDFTLNAVLKMNGEVIDDITETYTCSDINPSLCKGLTIQIIGGIGLAILLIAGVGYIRMKRIQNRSLPLQP